MTRNDRLAAAMLVMLITIVAVVALFAANDPYAFKQAERHPQFASMQVGGPAADRDADHWWIGWLVGSLVFAFLGSMVIFGVNQIEGPVGGLRTICHLVTLSLLGMFAYGNLAYRDFGLVGQPLIKTIAPHATKVLFLAVWIVPMLFVAVFVVGFDRWFSAAARIDESEQRD